MIPQETIQQIVSQIDIVDIVGDFVRLKRRGANYLGLCPFHDEKTPSFTVSPTKEIYKCFGCGRSGNAITFLMEHEKYSYVEAIKWLAKKYNIEIEETNADPEYRQKQQAAESLYAVNNFARKHFSDNLTGTEEGRNVGLSYLKQRGFREHTIKEFDIGYCLSDNSFARLAIQQQFNKDLLVKSGLVVHRNGDYADNYRSRIIFPIHNQTGKIVGFGARLIQKNDRAPKYINTPENEIYVKSRILYGLWQARREIGKKDECILVEGYADVVSMHQAGIGNVVASSGTSITTDQLHLIRKITKNLTIFYDGDAAGTAATIRGLNMALEEGLNVKIVSLPSHEDPDSYINNYGAAALEEYIAKNKKEFIFYQLDMALAEAGTDTRKKSEAVRQIAESISKLNRAEDFVVRQDFIRQVCDRLGLEEEGLIALINSITREAIEKKQKKFLKKSVVEIPLTTDEILAEGEKELEANPLFNNKVNQENALIRCLLESGFREWDENKTVAQVLLNESGIDSLITDEKLIEILHIYRQYFAQGEYPDLKKFLYNEDQSICERVISIIKFPYELSKNWKEKYRQYVPNREDEYKNDITSILRYMDLWDIKHKLTKNQDIIKNTDDPDKLKTLLLVQQNLKNTERDLMKGFGIVIMK